MNKTDKTSILNRKSTIINIQSENGYVLVVIIGILTILSLMTITFATLSRIETKATRNYTDSVKCEMVAKAGLEQALYVLRLDKFGTDTTAYNNDNGDENYDWSGETWMPGNIDLLNPTTSFAGNAVGDCDNDGDDTPESKWIYFPLTDQAGTSTNAIRLPGNLLARYAVLITDDREARVNVNVAGDQPGNEGTSTTEIDMSSVIEKTGLTPLEGDSIANNIISTRSSMPFGVLTEAEIAEIAGTSTQYTSRLEEIFESYIGTGWETAYEDCKETLTAFSADNIVCPSYTLDNGTSTTRLNINALVRNEGAYTNTVTYDSDKKVEMIMDILVAGGLTGASGTSNYVEHHQLAVNIKDFIDSNGTVTTYNDGVDTYYGVEATPYINEVEAEVDGTATDAAGTQTDMGKFIELFNPYDITIDLANWTITGTIMPPVTLTGTIGSQAYYVIADDENAYIRDDNVDPKGFSYEGGTEADQYEPDVNSLKSDGEVLTLKDNSNNIVQVTNYGTGDDPKSMQMNDPRPTPLEKADGSDNINTANPWRWEMKDITAGAENGNFDPTKGQDGWTNGTWTSSFVIPNRYFSNKGYLGFMHNGRQWTSFRVDKEIIYPDILTYITVIDPSMDNIDNDGDGYIDAVDTGTQTADIDGKEYRIPGLINVNTASEEVLMSLPNVDATIATAIFEGSKPYESIGDLVDKVDITGSGTKWDAEKAFRSISNLITTRSNVFTVYVTAQITDDAISNVYAEKRILAIVDRSLDPIKIRYFRWITE